MLVKHARQQIGVKAPMDGVVYPNPVDLRRYMDSGALGQETLADGFRSMAHQFPSSLALAGLEGEITYKELDQMTDRLATALLRLGLQSLDRVVFQLGNSPQLIVGWLACLKAGLIPICTLAAHREQEIGYLAELAEAKLHFVQGDDPKFDDVAFARKMQAKVTTLRWILQARGEPRGGALSLAEMIASVNDEDECLELQQVELDPYQVAVFQLSGGTTGVPKIIPRFNNEYLYNMRSVARWMGYRANDVLFVPQPLVHNFNMACMFGPFLMTGGTVTVSTNILPETLLELITKYRPHWLALNGPIAARLEKPIANGDIDFTRARGVVAPNGAAKMRKLVGVPVYHCFGMTEGVIAMTHDGDSIEALETTVGRPVSPQDEIRILVPGTETEVAPGEIGEPAFKGPYTIHGYYRAPERNSEAFTSDGYYRSGDLMREVSIEGNRYFVFCGRLKDVISRGGEKINAQELELAVSLHPAIASVSVVGMPDPVYGEKVCAFVVEREGHQAPNVRELGTFLQDYGLAKFKWPERIEVVQAFPMTKSGKLSKADLRAMITDRLART